MIVKTIEECLEVFKKGNYNTKVLACEKMERMSEWDVAAVCWGQIGHFDDQQICRTISKAIKSGDPIRKEMGKINEIYEIMISAGIDKNDALKFLYPYINIIHT